MPYGALAAILRPPLLSPTHGVCYALRARAPWAALAQGGRGEDKDKIRLKQGAVFGESCLEPTAKVARD